MSCVAEKFTCSICLDFASEHPNRDYFVTTKCGHLFHLLCIWQQPKPEDEEGMIKQCPICRESLTRRDLTRLYGVELQNSEESVKGTALAERLPTEVKDKALPLIKIVILGNSTVGKTCILHRFADHGFNYNYTTTVGTDIVIRNIQVGGQLFRLSLWDTAGQEKFRSVVSTIVRGVHGIVLAYDITDPRSMNDIKEWLEFAQTYGREDSVKIIVGNKNDLEESRQVTRSAGKAVADKFGFSFFETSAKSGYYIEAVFRTLVASILELHPTLSQSQPQQETNTVQLELQTVQGGRGRKCCRN